MSTCEIKTLSSGEIRVETYPQLFREIQNYTKNRNKTLSLYGMTMTEEFKSLNLKNPKLEDLLQFVDNYNSFESKELTRTDRQLFMDLTLSNNTFSNVMDLFIDSFTVDGVFGVNADVLRDTGLFDEYTILEMMNQENLAAIQKLYYKLKENNEDFNNVITPFVISDGTQFGKLNPDVVLTGIYNNYIGLETEQSIIDKANEIQDEVVLNNPNIIPSILKQVQDKQLLVSYETDADFSEVVKKTNNNTKVTLENTLDFEQNFQPLAYQIEVLLNLDISQFAYDYTDVKEYVYNIEKQAAKLGLDLNNLSEVIENRNYNEVQEYLTSLYNFLSDINNRDADLITESFDQYVISNDAFFRVTPQFQSKVVDQIEGEGVYLDLETNRNEQDLFLERSIIKVGENTYQKINDDKTQEELNQLLLNTNNLIPNQSDMSLEDVDDYVTRESKELLGEYADIAAIKKITAYKILLDAEATTEKTVPDTSYLVLDNVNPERFLIDFNKELLKNSKLKEIFYFSNRGLEAKQEIGAYTLNQLQNELSETMFDKLGQYALISNNSSLSALKPQYELLETDDVNILRNFYANNLNQLQEVSVPYQIIGNGAIAENITNQFIKIKGHLYEQITPNVYERLDIDNRFRNYDLKKPTSSIDNPQRYLSTQSKEAKSKVKTTNIDNSQIEFC